MKSKLMSIVSFLCLFILAGGRVQATSSHNISEILKLHLAPLVAADDFDVILDQKVPEVWEGKEVSLNVIRVDMKPEINRFEVSVSNPSTLSQKKEMRLTGRIRPMVDIPTLARPLSPHEIIEAKDIAWMRLPADRLQPGMIRKAEDIQGLKPRMRVLQPGKPLFERDLQRPVLVKRGSLILVTYKTPGLMLTARAIAKTDGCKGDTIALVREGSKQTLHGIVCGENEVTIQPLGGENP